ncbi:MAG: hypothetical protein GAK41_01200 [Burkholderia gladioli]|nr:MAG: hypothetical protein GAK41_01200 [Burkholderia gladioli]
MKPRRPNLQLRMGHRPMRTVLFLIAGKLDFSKINPHVA